MINEGFELLLLFVRQVKISGGGRCNVTNGHCADNMVRIIFYLLVIKCPRVICIIV